MFKRAVLLLLAVAALAAVVVVPATAANKKLFSCGRGGATPNGVDRIRARNTNCGDARAVIRSVETAHKQFCRPQKGTIAPYRICNVEVALPSGVTKTFHCVASFITSPDFREVCTSPGSVRIQYIRNYNNLSR